MQISIEHLSETVQNSVQLFHKHCDGRFVVQELHEERFGTFIWNGTEVETKQPVLVVSKSIESVNQGTLFQLVHDLGVLAENALSHVLQVGFHQSLDGVYWIVYRLAASQPVQYDRDIQTVPVIAKLKIFRDILNGLSQLLSKGIVHRSLHPQSIYLTPDDSGSVARLLPVDLDYLLLGNQIRIPDSDQFLGYASFISPEQIGVIPFPCTEISNVYSAGCLLNWLFTGTAPFEASSLRELLVYHGAKQQPRFIFPTTKIPRAVTLILRRSVQFDLISRYQSIDAMLFDVDQLIAALAERDSDPDLRIGSRDVRKTLLQPTFVARKPEIHQLVESLKRVKLGESGLGFIEGESGFGKSRLVAEFTNMALQSGVRVFVGKCSTDQASETFDFLQGVIKSILDINRDDPAFLPRIREELQEKFAAILSIFPELDSNSETEADWNVGETGGESFLLLAFASLIDSLGSPEHPAVVFLDDIQWSAEVVLGLVQRWKILRDTKSNEQHFVKLILVFRSEEVSANHSLRTLQPGLHVKLGPLQDADVGRLLETMAGPLPQRAVQAVVRLADGVPFMASAILMGMVESKALNPTLHGWEIDELELDKVQSSAHAADFLVRRLSFIEDKTLRLLKAGSVLGSEFNLFVAMEMAQINSIDAIKVVNDARKRHLMWDNLQTGECTFVHDKIRTSLLSIQTEEQRQAHHRLAAGIFETRFPDQLAELAYHLDAAGDYEKAYPIAMQAALVATRRHLLELAEQQYLIAYRGSHGQSRAKRFQVCDQLGGILLMRGKYDHAEQMMEEAGDLVEGIVPAAELRRKQAELLKRRGDMQGAVREFLKSLELLGITAPKLEFTKIMYLTYQVIVQVFHTALPKLFLGRFRRLPDERETLILKVYSGLSHACWYCRSLPLGMWAHLKGMNVGELYHPSPELAQSYSDHSPAMLLCAFRKRGLRYVQNSEKIRIQFHDLWGQGQSLSFHGVLCYSNSQYEACIQKCSQAVQIMEKIGDFWQVHIARYQIAAAYYRLGDYQRAFEESRKNYTSGILLKDEQASGIILDVWARVRKGKVPDQILMQEIERYRTDTQGQTQVQLALGVQYLGKGNYADAVHVLRQASLYVLESGVKNHYTVSVFVWFATALRLLAESEKSRTPQKRDKLIQEAFESLRYAKREIWRFTNDIPHLFRELGFLHAMQGRIPAAQDAFQSSLQYALRHRAAQEYTETYLAFKQLIDEVGLNIDIYPPSYYQFHSPDSNFTDHLSLFSKSDTTSLSLIDRFETLIDSGRVIASALSKDAIVDEVVKAARKLFRTDVAFVIWFDELNPLMRPTNRRRQTNKVVDPLLLERCVEQRSVVVTLKSENQSFESLYDPAICAPLMVRGQIIACLVANYSDKQHSFDRDEIRIAEFISKLAGAALENADGFLQLGELNHTLERRVKNRTRLIEERALELTKSNKKLENMTNELLETQNELVRSKQAAESANEAKSRFLAAMSHEIRTPLNGVIGMSQLLQSSDLNPRQRAQLATVIRSANSLLKILNDVLDFSKIEAGRMLMENLEFNLHETILDVVRLFSPTAIKKQIALEYQVHPNVPQHVLGDPNRLSQVLSNLVGNALKFTENGHVDLIVQLESPDLSDAEMVDAHFIVKDDGVGISPDLIERIFLPFDQGEVSITRRFGGTGLGLSISSQFVKLMKGRIWVESKPGVGSEFHFVIPLNLVMNRNRIGFPPIRRQKILYFMAGETHFKHRIQELESLGFEVKTADLDNAMSTMIGQGTTDYSLILFEWTIRSSFLVEDVRVLLDFYEGIPSLALLPHGLMNRIDELKPLNLSEVLEKPITFAELDLALQRVQADLQKPEDEAAVSGEIVIPLSILVTDDSPINLEVAEGIFELLGHKVIKSESGFQTLELLKKQKFDVVFMDIEMPELDGIRTTELIRARERELCQRPVPIFAMTAHVLASMQNECVTAGMNGFITKPLKSNDLIEAVELVKKIHN